MEVHIAGVEVQVGSQVRQRCSWCGAVISDYDLASVAVQLPEGWESMTDQEKAEACRLPSWECGALIGRDGGATWVVDHEDGAALPPECCGQLPFEVTGSPSVARR